MSSAAGMTIGGIASVAVDPGSAPDNRSAIKRIQIDFQTGVGLPVYTHFQGGSYAGFRAKNGSQWNVLKTALDQAGNLWYELEKNEWIKARYTIDLPLAQAQKSKAAPKIAALVELGKKQIGKNYVTGAAGPDGFDSAGLLQFLFDQALDLALPNKLQDQVKMGRAVSLAEKQAGDLLFWGSAAAPYHAAIYLGANQYLEASATDQAVMLKQFSPYIYPTVIKRLV